MIQSHIVNFDLSKRLHELGVKKESIFYWGKGDYQDKDKIWILPFQDEENWPHDEIYPAYIAAEILGMLPCHIIDGKVFWLDISKYDTKQYYKIFYASYERYYLNNFEFQDDNLCSALAKMLIYLIENKLVDANKINQGDKL